MAGKPEVWKDHGSKEEPPVRTDMEPWLGYEDACGSPQVPGPETWRTYPIAPDVVVMIRAGASPWRMRRLLSALERFGSEIRDDGTKKEDRGE